MKSLWLIAFFVGFALTGLYADWETVRGDVKRSGSAEKAVRGPVKLLFKKEWTNEHVMTRMEAIVSGDHVFVATRFGEMGGRLRALDKKTGEEKWLVELSAPAGHSPAVQDGKLLVGCSDGFVYCLDSKTGKEIWKKKISGRGGFMVSPCIVDETAYMGGRDGFFYAFSIKNGNEIWKYDAGTRIANTAAYADDTVYFVSEDIVAHALDAKSGKSKWKSAQLYGKTSRAYYPVIWKDKLVFRTNSGIGHGEMFGLFRWGKLNSKQGWLKRIDEEPELYETYFVLDAKDGSWSTRMRRPWFAGEDGVPCPPCVDQDGKVYNTEVMLSPDGGVYGGKKDSFGDEQVLARLDLTNGAVEVLIGKEDAHKDGGFFIPDESANVNIAGGVLYMYHQNLIQVFDTNSGKFEVIWGKRDTYLGELPVVWNSVEWHGPERGGLAFDDDRMYALNGHRLFAFKGAE